MHELTVTGEVIYWRGPAPHHFVPVRGEVAEALRALAPAATYGWGMIPVRARCGEVEFTTSLFPKDGNYLLPLKVAARRVIGCAVGDTVSVELEPVFPEF